VIRGGSRTGFRTVRRPLKGAAAVVLVAALVLLAAPAAAVAPGIREGGGPATMGVSLTAEPLNGTAPFVVDLRATLSPSSLSATFDWSFGDGSTLSEVATAYSAVSHYYATVGTFVANVFVSSIDGDANASVVVQSGASTLAVDIVASPRSGPAPLTVHLVADISGGTGTYTAIVWKFGDGTNGSGSDLEYTYATPGNFDAIVNVTDSSGTSATASVAVTVTAGPSVAGSGSDVSAPPYATAAWILVALLVVGAFAAVAYRGSMLRRRDSVPPPSLPATSTVATPTGFGVTPSSAPEALATPESMDVASSAPQSSREDSRRLSERILVHLYWYGRPTSDGVARPDSSQAGMARRLGVGQNSISKSLQRLVDAGLVSMELRHVPGAPRRLRTYALTSRGEATARGIRAEPGRRSPP
jgi:PKD repeat protein